MAAPEWRYWEISPDTGCAVSPSCLRCPLARCVYDEGGTGVRKLGALAQAVEICRLTREGLTKPQIVAALGCCESTVARARRQYPELVRGATG